MNYAAGERRSRNIVAAFFGGFLALAVVAGRSFEASVSASPPAQREGQLNNTQFISEGAKFFATSCGNAYCHGTGGIGGGAPRLRGKGLDAAYLFNTISNGIPGTGMLSFKSELSEQQIWKLVAFITSDAKTTPAAKPGAATADKPASQPAVQLKPSEPAAVPSTVGSIQAGKALFFDPAQTKRCGACHSFDGEGTPIGPDLSKAGIRSPRELFLSIILPNDAKDAKYATVTLTLRNGEKIRGIKKEEDDESIRVYDTTELPAVLRTVQKADVAKLEAATESIMPKDYASAYTLKQLLDLVTFLKASESRVTLKDLFQ
jgi:putative heme-binding domain-containing protein